MSQSHGLRKTITISIFLEKVRYDHISAPHLQRSRENFAQLVILEYYSVWDIFPFVWTMIKLNYHTYSVIIEYCKLI